MAKFRENCFLDISSKRETCRNLIIQHMGNSHIGHTGAVALPAGGKANLGFYFPTGIIINSAPQNANVLYRSLEVSIAQKG